MQLFHPKVLTNFSEDLSRPLPQKSLQQPLNGTESFTGLLSLMTCPKDLSSPCSFAHLFHNQDIVITFTLIHPSSQLTWSFKSLPHLGRNWPWVLLRILVCIFPTSLFISVCDLPCCVTNIMFAEQHINETYYRLQSSGLSTTIASVGDLEAMLKHFIS